MAGLLWCKQFYSVCLDVIPLCFILFSFSHFLTFFLLSCIHLGVDLDMFLEGEKDMVNPTDESKLTYIN